MTDKAESPRWPPAKQILLAAIILRLTLAAGLLSAVADRFGVWGPPGKPMVAWGTFGAFLDYTAKLNPWCPAKLVMPLGWTVTIAETVLGVALIAGYRLRVTALLVAALTAAFSLAMTIILGVHAPLNYSVFSFAAGAYLLSRLTERQFSSSSGTQNPFFR